jgi:hypothetical protein
MDRLCTACRAIECAYRCRTGYIECSREFSVGAEEVGESAEGFLEGLGAIGRSTQRGYTGEPASRAMITGKASMKAADEQSTYTSAARTLVTARPHAAADGLEALARKRIESLEVTRRAIYALGQ